MKRTFLLLMALLLVWAVLPAGAEVPETVAEVNPEAAPEDFAGEYVCGYLLVQGKPVPADLEAMRTEEVPTLRIEGETAVFTGLTEMGTDPVKLVFADGTLCFEPEENVRVFTLRLLQDDTVTMTFDMMEFAPVFCFVKK